MSEPKSAIASALLAAQMEMPAVDRDGVNPHFKSKFTTLGNLLAKSKPVLNKHGVAVAQFPSQDDAGNPTLVTILLHESGEKLEFDAPLLLPKNDPQGQGSAITYMRRYALASALGISDQEDDDGSAGATARERNGSGNTERAASEKQRNYASKLIEDAKFADDQLALIRAFCRNEEGKFKAAAASFLIENLKDGTAEGRGRVLEQVGYTDVPLDAEPDLSDFEPDGKEAPTEEPVPGSPESF